MRWRLIGNRTGLGVVSRRDFPGVDPPFSDIRADFAAMSENGQTIPATAAKLSTWESKRRRDLSRSASDHRHADRRRDLLPGPGRPRRPVRRPILRRGDDDADLLPANLHGP